MQTLLCSAFTPGYCDLAGRLSASARRFSVELALTEYQSTGSWTENGHIKPTVLMRAMLDSGRKRPVCWVDADAEIVASPHALDSLAGCDVAICRVGPKEVLSGTVWLAPTPAAMWLLCAWADECREHPTMWDQSAMQRAIDRARAPVRVGKLDPAYCFIPGTTVLKRGEPVIVHHQASREVRAGTRRHVRVGVVMPTYNQARYMPEALASLHAQTFPSDRFEVLAVDDCSTDATPEILAAQGDAIYRIAPERNGGCGAAINLGVDAFSGLTGWEPDAFTWVSSDNVMRDGRLATLSAALKPGVGAVFSAFDMPGEKPGKTITVRQGKYDPARLVSSENCYFGPSFLIRTEVWRTAGPHEGKAAHDYGHWARVEEACWAAGLSIVYVDKPLVWYRIHDEQTVKRRPDLHDAAEQRAAAIARRAAAR